MLVIADRLDLVAALNRAVIVAGGLLITVRKTRGYKVAGTYARGSGNYTGENEGGSDESTREHGGIEKVLGIRALKELSRWSSGSHRTSLSGFYSRLPLQCLSLMVSHDAWSGSEPDVFLAV